MSTVKTIHPKTREIKEFPESTWKMIKGKVDYIEDAHYIAGVEKGADIDAQIHAEEINHVSPEQADKTIKEANAEVVDSEYKGAHWKVQLKAVEEATSESFLDEIESVATSKKVLKAIEERRNEIHQ